MRIQTNGREEIVVSHRTLLLLMIIATVAAGIMPHNVAAGPSLMPSTSVTCSPSTLIVGVQSICTATVYGGLGVGVIQGTGTVSWSSSGSGSFSTSSCVLSSGSCSVSYTPSSALPRNPTITGSYSGDSNLLPGSGTATLTVLVSNIVSSYSQFQTWLPIIFLAIILSLTIVSVYYIAGVLLDNSTVKAGAISEMGQAIGTGIITVIIIGVFALVGTGQLSLSILLSPSNVNTVCQQLTGSSISSLNSRGLYGSGSSAIPTPTNTICSVVASLAGGGAGSDITPQLDYGLFATYVINANLSNQAADNLNAFYLFTGWTGFLAAFVAKAGVCAPATCEVPGSEELSVNLESSYRPLAGYETLEQLIIPTQTTAVYTFYIMYMQLLITTLLLFIWPYLLAAGIILHSTLFTRRLGGLLMAIALAAVLVYPILYVMEYSAFNTGTLGPIGTSNFPINSMALYEQPTSGNAVVYGVNTLGGYVSGNAVPSLGCSDTQYVYENICGYPGTQSGGCTTSPGRKCTSVSGANINFFVLPRADQALRYYNCWPGDALGGLLGNEAWFAAFYLIPGFSLGGELLNGIGGLIGVLPFTPLNIPVLFNGCTPDRAINAALAMTNLYGISFISGIMLPILNILVALAAMSGFATLVGGDTDIAGLGKLL